MPPRRASSAGNDAAPQSAAEIAARIEEFLARHPSAVVLEAGKAVFDLGVATLRLSTEHERCMLHLWSEERTLVRPVVAATERDGSLRLATQPFGQTQTRLLQLVADRERRTPTIRDAARTGYVKVLQRALARQFCDWSCVGFRTAMDLERSFGPGYARGSLERGNQAWAVAGVNASESATTVDGVLTVGILWLHACRQRAEGKRLYQGLKVVVPRSPGGRAAALTLSRMAWLNRDAAEWELWELDERSEELVQLDPADHGNLRTALVHRPDEAAAERFAAAAAQVMALVPSGEAHRVEQRLRGPAELAFLLHGLEFARARIGLAANSFAHTLEITVGAATLGAAESESALSDATRAMLAERVAELFARRRAVQGGAFTRRDRFQAASRRRIGAPMATPAHAKAQGRVRPAQGELPPLRDPLYRAAPERWLESVLRRDLAPLTRGLAPEAAPVPASYAAGPTANDPDPDTFGNRAGPEQAGDEGIASVSGNRLQREAARREAEGPGSRVVPRLDPRHVYAQVPAIAGASDRGLLDLLGVTADGRLAVIELKADDDLHFALQGLDYWIRVRHHHLQHADARTGLGEFQRHGYFRGVELSPLPPRLYLVAPALHIHPATETVLRYISPRVEWNLLALDERWRAEIRVVWRRQGGRSE